MLSRLPIVAPASFPVVLPRELTKELASVAEARPVGPLRFKAALLGELLAKETRRDDALCEGRRGRCSRVKEPALTFVKSTEASIDASSLGGT